MESIHNPKAEKARENTLSDQFEAKYGLRTFCHGTWGRKVWCYIYLLSKPCWRWGYSSSWSRRVWSIHGRYEGFVFLAWFRETVQYADFMVLKMNEGEVALKFLSDLLKNGAICFIDELFFSCSDQNDKKDRVKWHCMDLFKSLN